MTANESGLLKALFEDDKSDTDVFRCKVNDSRQDINKITEKIIGCSYTVSNALGCGFLEKVYENALAHELNKIGFEYFQQHPIKVYYDGVTVGEYVADLFVEGLVIIELKALKGLEDSHVSQCLNYLKATGIEICLLINFGKPRVEIKRIAL
jgi:GxxExxY protein